MPDMRRGQILVTGIVAGFIVGIALAALLAFAVFGVGGTAPSADAAASGHWQVKYANSAGRLSSAIAGIPSDCRVDVIEGDNNDYYIAYGCPGD